MVSRYRALLEEEEDDDEDEDDDWKVEEETLEGSLDP